MCHIALYSRLADEGKRARARVGVVVGVGPVSLPQVLNYFSVVLGALPGSL